MNHSKIPPSHAELVVNCPGSVKLGALYPREETDATMEGTAWHYVAFCLATDQPLPAVAPNGVPITAEMIDHAEQFVHLVDGRPGPVSGYEERIEIPAVHEECWGTPDVYQIDSVNRLVRLYDGKYGHRYVDAYRNWQLAAYLSGLYSLTDGGADWRFEATIFQPRNFHPDGPVRTWRPTAAELSEMVRHLRVRCEEALSDNPWTQAGPWCKDCSANRACQTLQDAGDAIMERVGQAVPVDLPPAQVGQELTRLSRAMAVLEARISGLESYTESLIRGGDTVPGWMIEHTKGREFFTAPVPDVLALGGLYGVQLAKPADAITPAQARKAGVPADVIAKIVDRRPGSAKLVPINPAAAEKALAASKE